MESGKKSSIECLIIVHELLRRPGTTNRERDVHDIRRVRQRLAESGWYDNGSLSHRVSPSQVPATKGSYGAPSPWLVIRHEAASPRRWGPSHCHDRDLRLG